MRITDKSTARTVGRADIAVAIIEASNTRSEKLLLGGRESLLVVVPAIELCELLRVEQVAFEGERGNARVLQQLRFRDGAQLQAVLLMQMVR